MAGLDGFASALYAKNDVDDAPHLIYFPEAPLPLDQLLEDVDSVFERAVQAGAKALRPVEDKFYGDRSGQFEDPFGHHWDVATHVEDVAPEEMSKRVAAMSG